MSRILSAIVCIGALLPVSAVAVTVESAVSPELAKKAAVVFLVDSHGSELGTGYPVKVSEPKVFFSYDNSRKYYMVYTYVGPGDIPTWEELEREPNRKREYFRYFIIPANRDECAYLGGQSGIPVPIWGKEHARKIIGNRYPEEEIEYVRTVVQGPSLYIVFRVSGKEYFVDPSWGHVYEASPEIGVAAPPDPEKYRELSEQMWEKVDNTDVSEYLVDINGGINLREGTEDSTYQPLNFYTWIPMYQKYDSQAPGGVWGCAPASLADFLGMYAYHKGYVWTGMPSKETYKDQSFGRWLMGDTTENKGGLYYKMAAYCDPAEASSAGIMACTLNDWLADYCPSTKFTVSSWNCSYFKPLTQWSTITCALNFKYGVALTVIRPGEENGALCLWGWMTTGTPTQHWVAGWTPASPAYWPSPCATKRWT